MNSGFPIDHTLPGYGLESQERLPSSAELERQRIVDAQIAMGWGGSDRVPSDWATRKGPEFGRKLRRTSASGRSKFRSPRSRRKH